MSCNDLFDAQDWDPDLVSNFTTSPDKSPEAVAIKPQPVAYTTVGSVVNPRAAPQFAAPHRIQREGAHQRKSLMSMISMHDQSRVPPPSLIMTNSMQYTQQLGRNNTPQPTNVLQPVTNRARPSLAQFVNGGVSEDEVRTLLYSLGHPVNNENEAPSVSFKNMTEEELTSRAGTQSGPIQGLHKMQTIQRLSKFPNPMQKVAQDRLSGLSVAQQTSRSSSTVPDMGRLNISDTGSMPFPMDSKPITHPGMPAVGFRLGDISAAKVMKDIDAAGGIAAYLAPHNGGLPEYRAPMFDSRFQSQGELDRTYQFPPSGQRSSSQANPLYGAYGSNRQGDPPPARPPGYPQPLTAGPPGQRQFPPASTYATPATEDPYSTEFQPNNFNPLQNDSAWDAKSQSGNSFTVAGQSFTTQPDMASKPSQPAFDSGAPRQVDTISLSDAHLYYPHGLPANMTGYWTPPQEDVRRQFGELPPLTAGEKKARKLEASDDRFYHNYRRVLSMAPKDYELEYDSRQVNPYGPVAPPPKVEPKKMMTVEQLNNMSEVEEAAALKPFLNAMYGTLVGHLDKTPGSRYSLSQWREAEEELLDRTKAGNQSYFGEDWGAPPKNTSISAESQAAPRAARGRGVPNPYSASQMLAAKHNARLS